MGKLAIKPFEEAAKKKFSDEVNAETKRKISNKALKAKAEELCSQWEEYLKDPNWHPFKIITDNGNSKVHSTSITSTIIVTSG
jgi:hypothetical protein